MKYKIGDKVRIKNFDWYNQNKDEDGFVHCGDRIFDDYMSVFCGSIVTICGLYAYIGYDVQEDMQCRTWTDEMIEGMAMETRYSIGDEVWWRSYTTIRHGKVYDIWVEPGNISYGIIESNGALVLYITERMLYPTKEELLKNLQL